MGWASLRRTTEWLCLVPSAIACFHVHTRKLFLIGSSSIFFARRPAEALLETASMSEVLQVGATSCWRGTFIRPVVRLWVLITVELTCVWREGACTKQTSGVTLIWRMSLKDETHNYIFGCRYFVCPWLLNVLSCCEVIMEFLVYGMI